ncbi:hypothetical protein G7085_11265 [Tessaracoccus sp. HDW20]|nr:hypothetical protein [Tessaracoccus coleopterorum]
MRIGEGFLGDLQRGNRKTSIPRGHEHLTEQQAWTNLDNAAARRVGEPYHGPVYEDGEVFKWLEAVAWQEGLEADQIMADWLDRYSDLAARAQADDGYFSTFNQAAGKRGRYEWISYDHEIFNMATLIQAAVAQYRASGRTVLLEVACRAADHMAETFGFGQREELCGHPLIEMALVELYRVTQNPRYLELASYFVEHRGHGTLTDPTWQGWKSVYFSDRIPVRETVYPEGHAVRAVYFAAGPLTSQSRPVTGSSSTRSAPSGTTWLRPKCMSTGRSERAGRGGVRRPVRAAQRPRLWRDLCGRRVDPVELAAVAGHR